MPISTPRDNNGIPTMLGTLNTDGITPVSIKINPSNNALKVDDNTTGTGFSSSSSQRDANRVPALWAVSSSDGVTPIYIATDSNGNLLIDSN